MQKNKHKSKVQTSELQAAWNFYKLGHFSDAESICHEVLEGNQKNKEALQLLGTISLHHGKADVATNLLTKSIELNNKTPDTFNNLGLAYHEQGLLDEAIKQYRRAIAVEPNYSDAQYNLHAALLNGGAVAPAIVCLQRALQINPHDMDACFMLGLLFDYEGKTDVSPLYFDVVTKASALYRARYDAWQYVKSANIKLPPILGSAIKTFQLAFTAANNDGLVLEFGVRFGNSIRMLAGLVDEQVHGFDSFEGLPDEWHHEPKGSYTTKGVIPKVPDNAFLHVGWFDDTLPKFLAEHSGPVRVINVDCDIYSSTKTVLELLAPRMVVGSVIVFDEYIGNEHWREDEFKAFQEAVTKYGWQYEYLCFSFFTKQVAVRITMI